MASLQDAAIDGDRASDELSLGLASIFVSLTTL